MVICSKCGSEVREGKFCEKCGAPLNHVENGNNAVGGFFDKIGTKFNKAASDILAIKSDYSNNVVLYKVNKIPNIQEKTIKIGSDEFVFFSTGGGFTKYDTTFTTNESNFLCFFIKRNTEIPNAFSISLDTKVKKIDDDAIKLVMNYDYVLSTEAEKFFDVVIGINQNSWTLLDVNSLIFKNLNNIIVDLIKEKLSFEGWLDLRNYVNQIKQYDNDIKEAIDKEVDKYGLKVKSFKNNNVLINTEEVNKVLIKNLYK